MRAIQAFDNRLEVEASYKRGVVYVGKEVVAKIDEAGIFHVQDAWSRMLPGVPAAEVEVALEQPRL